MKEYTDSIIQKFWKAYPEMRYLDDDLRDGIEEIVRRIRKGGKILVCGNGGSASDSEHIVGELLKEFHIRRPIEEQFVDKISRLFPNESDHISRCLQGGIPAISLASQTSFLTAYGNDVNYNMVYGQQVYVYGKEEDIFLGLSTSGDSKNVVYGAQVAKAKGLLVIGFTGETGGKLQEISDFLFKVPSNTTYRIQEYHIPLYHLLCRAIEYEIFGESI